MSKKRKSKGVGHIHYDIMRRCYNEKDRLYHNYGAKGITVCEEWHNRPTFVKWAKENGYNSEVRLQRKDSSKGYCPDNCYFGTKYKKQEGGYNQLVRHRAEINKLLKKAIGTTSISKDILYKTYISMHERCYDKKHKHYKHYGGRGIKVCKEWSGQYGYYNFKLWALQNGWQKGLTLDRIDVNGNYKPNNCRWATAIEQANNKRNTVFIDYNNKKYPFSVFCREFNINRSKAYYYLKKGCNAEEIIDKCKEV